MSLPWRLVLWLAAAALLLRVIVVGVVPAFRAGGGDFANFYTASRLLVDGQPLARSYQDFAWFQQRMDQAGFADQVGGFIPHPPPAALLFVPMLSLSPAAAHTLWTLLNIAIAAICVLLLARLSGLNLPLTTFIFLLSGTALANNFRFGQLYLLTLGTILGGLWCASTGRPRIGGILLGSLAPIKYVGLLWLAYFAWTRRWPVVAAASVAGLLVVALTLGLSGPEPFTVFLSDVLPAHLAGEIQNPFATRFQAWPSLLRRLFIAEPTLNPEPAFALPAAFFIGRHLVTWTVAVVSLFVLTRAELDTPRQTRLFQWAIIPLAVLLTAPEGATYHYLLLTITAVFLVAVLVDQGRTLAASVVVAWFGVLNLPHYLWLEPLAHGWWTPFAYSRLWLLTGAFIGAIVYFRHWIRHPDHVWRWAVAPVALAVAVGAWESDVYGRRPDDSAAWLHVEGGTLDQRDLLIQRSPSQGGGALVFTSIEYAPDGWALYDAGGRRWTKPQGMNVYHPAIAPDGLTALFETVRDGTDEIWRVSAPDGTPEAWLSGSDPSWSADGSQVAFVRDGALFVAASDRNRVERLPVDGVVRTPAFVGPGSTLAFVASTPTGTSLRLIDIRAGAMTRLLESTDTMSSPSGSPDGRQVVFSWDRNGNRDLWIIDVSTRAVRRLTTHPATDDEPVWDAAGQRIVFTSDRGRGLEFRTLFWLPVPAERP